MSELAERGSATGFAVLGVLAIGAAATWWIHSQGDVQGSWNYVIQCPGDYHPNPKVSVIAEAAGGHLLRFTCDANNTATSPQVTAPTDIWPLHHTGASLYGHADPSYGTVWQATIHYDKATGFLSSGGTPMVVLDTDPHSPRPQSPALEVSPIHLAMYDDFSVTNIAFAQLSH